MFRVVHYALVFLSITDKITNPLWSTFWNFLPIFKGEKLLLEPKEDVKGKIGHSPDHMDSLMLTFALPVEKHQGSYNEYNSRGPNNSYDYDPLSKRYNFG